MNDLLSRSQRVIKTVLQIYISFIELIKQKDVDLITVKELTEQAKISRGTFYTYFSDTKDVVQSMEEHLLEQMPSMKKLTNKRIPSLRPITPTLEDCRHTEWEKAFFLYFQTHKEPLNALLGPHGHGQFYTRLKQRIMSELNYQMQMDGFPNDTIRKYFQSIYADIFLILAQEWTRKKYHDDLDLDSLCEIATTIRIGSQYRAALELEQTAHRPPQTEE